RLARRERCARRPALPHVHADAACRTPQAHRECARRRRRRARGETRRRGHRPGSRALRRALRAPRLRHVRGRRRRAPLAHPRARRLERRPDDFHLYAPRERARQRAARDVQDRPALTPAKRPRVLRPLLAAVEARGPSDVVELRILRGLGADVVDRGELLVVGTERFFARGGALVDAFAFHGAILPEILSESGYSPPTCFARFRWLCWPWSRRSASRRRAPARHRSRSSST